MPRISRLLSSLAHICLSFVQCWNESWLISGLRLLSSLPVVRSGDDITNSVYFSHPRCTSCTTTIASSSDVLMGD